VKYGAEIGGGAELSCSAGTVCYEPTRVLVLSALWSVDSAALWSEIVSILTTVVIQ